MMYDSLRDLANRPLPDLDGLADPSAYRLGITEEDGVARAEAEHTEFLYASVRRPLGMWFDPPVECDVLGGSRRASVAGTSVPLGIETLNSFELVPLDRTTRAASVLKEWDERGRPTLASGEGDRYEGFSRVCLWLQVPEHSGDWTLAVYDERGPVRHFEYDIPNEDIYSMGSGLVLCGLTDLLRDDQEMIPPRVAEDIVNRWLADGAPALS